MLCKACNKNKKSFETNAFLGYFFLQISFISCKRRRGGGRDFTFPQKKESGNRRIPGCAREAQAIRFSLLALCEDGFFIFTICQVAKREGER